MTLADRLLCHAQALQNHALHADQKLKPLAAQSHRAAARLLREAAAEMNK
jgi:hypothetical protein